MLVVDMTSHDVFCSNSDILYVLSDPADIVATTSNTAGKGIVVVSDITTGLNRNRVYIVNTSQEFAAFVAGQTVKSSGALYAGLGTVDCNTASANVVGSGTNFSVILAPFSHVIIDANPYAVKSITNNTFLTLWTKALTNTSANSWSVVPTGTVRTVTDQAQRAYGKIRHIAFVSPGSEYLTPPLVTANSVSAQAQALYHYDP
jgi:hypothetical protein